MLAKIVAIARKDLQVYFADRKAMLISIAVPIAIASFFGFVMVPSGGSSAPTKIQTLIVEEDTGPLMDEIRAEIKKNDAIDPRIVKREEAEEKVKKGDVGVAVIFPKGFGDAAKRALFNNQPPKLEVLYDPSKSMDRQVVEGALMQSLMSKITQAGMTGESARDNLEMAIQSTTNPKRKAAWEGFLSAWNDLDASGGSPGRPGVGGMSEPFKIESKAMTAAKDSDADAASGRAHVFAGLGIQGILFFAIDAAMSLLREKRIGLWTRIRASQTSATTILLGRGLGSTLIALLILACVLAFGMVAMGIRVEGSWLALGIVAAASALMTATFGLLVASLGKTEQQSRGLSILAVLMMAMLGGAWFPIWLMPGAIQTVSKAVPVRWAVEGLDSALWRGGGLSTALVPTLWLLGFSILFAGIAAWRFKSA